MKQNIKKIKPGLKLKTLNKATLKAVKGGIVVDEIIDGARSRDIVVDEIIDGN